MIETWAPVVGFEGAYEVSTSGKVKRISSGRVLSPGLNSSGRWAVNLHWDGIHRNALIHRIVAEAFIPNPDGLPLVLHWDDNPGNNHVENLRWGTKRDNMLDAIRNGKWEPWGRRITRCPRGHEYTEENTYSSPNRPNSRMCRTCIRERYLAKKQRKDVL